MHLLSNPQINHGTIKIGFTPDGSRLSFMGLPCPNLGTGCHNAHSRMELASAQSMDKVVESLITIAEIYTDYNV